jgi:hypothetical protein
MSGQYSVGQVAGAFGSAIGNLFGFAQGINYMPSDAIIKAHEGEAIVPKHLNPYNPNAQTNGLGGGDIHLHGDINVQGARNYNEGVEVGRGITDGILERWREKGGS